MIEISYTEIFLLVWTGLATAGYLHERNQHKMARHLLEMFIKDADARKEMIDSYNEWQKSRT